MPIKAIFFDLDGTLVDFDASVESAFDEAYALVTRYHPQLQKADFRSRFDATLSVMIAAERRGVPQYISRDDRFSQTLRALGYPDEGLAKRLAEVYSTMRIASLQTFGDVRPTLDTLKPRYPLGVITNGPTEVQTGQLQATDIVGYFQHILISEEVGYAKPHEEIFRRAVQLAEASPEEVLYIGDTPQNDIAGARAAGLRTVWINRNQRPWPSELSPPDYTLVSLHQLIELV